MKKTYLKYFLTSFLYAGCFGVLYNIIVYVVWTKSFIGPTYDFRMLVPALCLHYGGDNLAQVALNIFDHDLVVIILHGFFSNLLLTSLFALLLLWINRKEGDVITRMNFSLKSVRLMFSIAMLIAIVILIGSYIFALVNKKMDWYPEHVMHERKFPASEMFNAKTFYIYAAILITLLYNSRLRKRLSVKQSV